MSSTTILCMVSSGTARSTVLCHEWITTYGGSEQVAQRIAQALDIDRIYTFVADGDLAQRLFPNRSVAVVSKLGRGAFARANWRWLLPVMSFEWAHLDLSSYDLVVTSSHACVNSIRPPAGARVISYCHTPMRYAWEWASELDRIPAPLRPLWPAVARLLRRADRRRSRNVSLFIANSQNVADRIRRYYGRDSIVIYPPIDTGFWCPSPDPERKDFFLYAGRLVAYKRPELTVRAAVQAGVELVVAGGGPALGVLKRLAASNVTFIENPSRDALRDLYRQARALVFTGVEDFGMTLVEAQACGTPVLAFKRGGALEAVVDGVTGRLYDDGSLDSVADEMTRFDPGGYERDAIVAHARSFDSTVFDRSIRKVASEVRVMDSVGVLTAEDLQHRLQEDL